MAMWPSTPRCGNACSRQVRRPYRLLVSARNNSSRRKKRKTSTKPSRQVPIRTFADWKEPAPGYLEIDFVAHGGSSVEGVFVWSLAATDVCTGWTEVVP